MTSAKISLLISSPFDAEHVERITAVAPEKVDVLFRPDLAPPMTYATDHDGPADFVRSSGAQAEWEALLERAEILLGLPREAETDLLGLCPNLKWLQGTSAGMGQAAKRLGLVESDVIVTTASGTHAQPLAEFVFAVLLDRAKRLDDLKAWQREHRWQRFSGEELAGKTIGIIGLGRIGSKIAAIARAFGMAVWAVSRSADTARADALGIDRLLGPSQLLELLGGSDVVVIIAPHTAETENLLGGREIAAMRPGVTLINIARGPLVDERAMIDALRSGQIGYAALDVFNREPLPDSELWDLPNVLISPHCSANTPSENRKILDIFISNLRCYVDGRFDQMSPVLDKERLY